jgi:hypothetical protein
VVKDTRDNYARTYKLIARYCAEHFPSSVRPDGSLILPMASETIKSFLGEMAQSRPDGSVKAISTITGYINVIKFYYAESHIHLEEDIVDYLKEFTNGYKRIVAKKKEDGLMKNFEGKVPIGTLLYNQLAKRALFASDSRSSFSSFVHSFMILCWNLMARSCSIADLRTHHFHWENDSLVIDMSKQKADQSGEKVTPKHVYANPWQPEICPILALALHFFAIAFRRQADDKTKIFLGTPYDVFKKWLPETLQNIALYEYPYH